MDGARDLGEGGDRGDRGKLGDRVDRVERGDLTHRGDLRDGERIEAPQCGSCARCGRALDLAAAKVDGHWYGNAACADPHAPCPLAERGHTVSEVALIPRPRRFFGRRAPKELRRPASGDGE